MPSGMERRLPGREVVEENYPVSKHRKRGISPTQAVLQIAQNIVPYWARLSGLERISGTLCSLHSLAYVPSFSHCRWDSRTSLGSLRFRIIMC